MGRDIYIALLHHPVLDKDGKVITTAVTNMDLHDLGRLARTYDVRACYVVQPLALQGRLVEKLVSYWRTGRGAEYNPTRKEAFELMRLTPDLAGAIEEIESETGSRPRVVGTTARDRPAALDYARAREELCKGGSWLIVFGTGWGIDPGFLESCTDLVLKPIPGLSGYNHLSVRTAAAVILDRLLGKEQYNA